MDYIYRKKGKYIYKRGGAKPNPLKKKQQEK
jgi:hypothetical protein